METTDYFDHDADIRVVGRGQNLEAAFEAAAHAMFAIMVDCGAVGEAEHVQFEFEEPDPEFALVTWLNRLLAEARSRGLVFGRFHVERDGSHWRGEAWGGPWRPDLERGTEVKGATLTMLAVRESGEGWEARCVVDV